jgi:25S rRNA (uracil2843-N3)-methyltransferase
MQDHLTTPPPLSKYASAAARASNERLIDPTQLDCSFFQADTLSLDNDALSNQVGSEPLIVTLMFTLNELYTDGGIGKTTKFLTNLGQILPQGSLLLVVDSPGSYSEAAVGKEKKRYPMQWLLNHTLLETELPALTWERLESEDSIWFRIPEGLSYPIQLENMRYQMHLYRVHKT